MKLLGACFSGLASSVSILCFTIVVLPYLFLFVAKAQTYFFSSFLALFLSEAARPATQISVGPWSYLLPPLLEHIDQSFLRSLFS